MSALTPLCLFSHFKEHLTQELIYQKEGEKEIRAGELEGELEGEREGRGMKDEGGWKLRCRVLKKKRKKLNRQTSIEMNCNYMN